jgi:hypothetical protein
LAFQDAAKRAGPVLLEPIMAVEMLVPEESVGDVIGDLNANGGTCPRWRGVNDAYRSLWRSVLRNRAVYVTNETEETRRENGQRLSVWARLNVLRCPWSPANTRRIKTRARGPTMEMPRTPLRFASLSDENVMPSSLSLQVLS